MHRALASQLSLNQEQHTEERHCHTTFPIAYEGLSHVPSCSPLLRLPPPRPGSTETALSTTVFYSSCHNIL